MVYVIVQIVYIIERNGQYIAQITCKNMFERGLVMTIGKIKDFLRLFQSFPPMVCTHTHVRAHVHVDVFSRQ